VSVHYLPARPHGWRPPEYVRACDALADALPAISPIERVTVSAWAERSRKLLDNGAVVGWRNDVVPYMREPMDMITSRRYRGAAFAGPARTGKTDGLVVNTIGQKICCDPGDIRVIHMDQAAAREFSIKKVSSLIRYTPDVKTRQATGRFSDNIFDKRFVGNMMLDIGWPVISKLSASDIPTMLLTDYDRMPDDIDGEGNPFDLAMKRTQTFGSRGMTAAESSPGRLLMDEDWTPSADEPHLAPPTSGVLALYNRGTRGRYYWQCRDCMELFEPDFDLLVYPKTGTPAERGAQAELSCRRCGSMIGPRHKREFNLAGRWLHEGSNGSTVEIGDAAIRETDIVSWWLKGACAAFQSWAEIVTKYEAALEEFDRTGDETSLKTTVTVDQGHPHRPRAMGTGSDLTVQTLKSRSDRYPLGIAPAATRFITVNVDVQGKSFVLHVDAWGPHLERWTIDRRVIATPPVDAPSADKRALDPGRYREDWEGLFDLLDEVFPVAGTGFGIRPCALIVDSGGADGVTANAYAFYRRARKLGHVRRIFISKGMPGWKSERAREVEPAKINQTRRKVPTDIRIVQIGTWRLKSEVVESLLRRDPGPDAYHLSDGLPEEVFEELCAERRTKDGWEVRHGQKRNEALDLAVYGKALAIVLGAESIDWDAPPHWAARVAENSFAVKLDPARPKDPEPVVVSAGRQRRVRSRGI
jgi:phage terminase large subunit GpA-like protein